MSVRCEVAKKGKQKAGREKTKTAEKALGRDVQVNDRERRLLREDEVRLQQPQVGV